jgi:hypothetical protein
MGVFLPKSPSRSLWYKDGAFGKNREPRVSPAGNHGDFGKKATRQPSMGEAK